MAASPFATDPHWHRSPLGPLSNTPQASSAIGLRAQSQRYKDSTAAMSVRLNDAPMDFDYESPGRVRHSRWLQSDRNQEAGPSKEGFARPSLSVDMIRQGSSTDSTSVPLSPTIEGPDIEMETSVQGHAEDRPLASNEASAQQEPHTTEALTRKPVSASNALMRPPKQRQHISGQGRSFSLSSLLGKSLLSNADAGKRQRRDRREEDLDWEDEDEGSKNAPRNTVAPVRGRRSSLRRRMGSTLNNYYFFGGEMARQHERGSDKEELHSVHHASYGPPQWTDPEWCLGMAQFAFNSTLLLGVAYLLFSIVYTLQRDVADKVREYELEFLAEIESCSQSFHLNKCGTEHAVPALASACAQWQRCSAKDPAIVGRSRVAAETIAEIVNGFVDVVSWKSMLFTLLFVIITVGATNSTLSFFRLRSRHGKEDGLRDDLRMRRPEIARQTHTPSHNIRDLGDAAHNDPDHHRPLPYNLRQRGPRSVFSGRH